MSHILCTRLVNVNMGNQQVRFYCDFNTVIKSHLFSCKCIFI